MSVRKAVVSSLRSVVQLTGHRGRRALAEAISNGHETLFETVESKQTRHGTIKFYCLNDLTRWRVETLLTKEPETIEWIDTFAEGDVLWDVGANIGLYSLYAAFAGAHVLAFEPAAENYLLLNRNVQINAMSDRISAICIALADRRALNALNMQSTEFGGAMSSFGEARDHVGKEFSPIFRQAMLGFGIDEFISTFDPLFPNHLKIDVDGIEHKIIAGAYLTLADRRLRSVSIELEDDRPDYIEPIIEKITAAGLTLVSKRHSPMFDNGPFANVFNYQFHR